MTPDAAKLLAEFDRLAARVRWTPDDALAAARALTPEQWRMLAGVDPTDGVARVAVLDRLRARVALSDEPFEDVCEPELLPYRGFDAATED